MYGISYRMKQKYNPIIVKRDGSDCFYCYKPFTELDPAEIDHLNDNPSDNRPENWVRCHRHCNMEKKWNLDYKIRAADKLEENERSLSVCEKVSEITNNELTSSQARSDANKELGINYLRTHVVDEGQATLNEIVPAMVNYCNSVNGTGSQSAMYRYVTDVCNRYNGEFKKIKEKGIIVIRVRKEEQKLIESGEE